jgi:hypothetical protein
MRINTLLRSDSAVTPEAMRRFQTDPGSVLPDLVMPHLQAAAARFNADSTRPALHQGASLLAEWGSQPDLLPQTQHCADAPTP